MTFKMPMEEIRKKYIEDNIVQGPSNLADIKSTFKYVIMHPTGTKEEAEEIASKLPIRHARKHVVKALLRYYFTYHQPRLYPRNNSNLTIQKCILHFHFFGSNISRFRTKTCADYLEKFGEMRGR